jgi:hypothetical protein
VSRLFKHADMSVACPHPSGLQQTEIDSGERQLKQTEKSDATRATLAAGQVAPHHPACLTLNRAIFLAH